MPTIESELKNNHSKLTMNPFKPLHLLLLHHGLFTLLESTTETFEASSNSSVSRFSTVTSGRLSSRYQSPASGNKHEAPSNTSVSRFSMATSGWLSSRSYHQGTAHTVRSRVFSAKSTESSTTWTFTIFWHWNNIAVSSIRTRKTRRLNPAKNQLRCIVKNLF